MNSNQRFAVAAGVLSIITTADMIAHAVLVQPILGAPDDLARISVNEGQVLMERSSCWSGLLRLAGSPSPCTRSCGTHNEALALGSVGFRLVEGAFYLGIVVCLLVLVTVSRESANAGTPASSIYEAPAALVMAARDSSSQVSVLIFGLGALMYYLVFHRSRLVPRWLSAWGPVAIISVMLSMLLVMFGLVESFSPPSSSWLFPSWCRRWSWPSG